MKAFLFDKIGKPSEVLKLRDLPNPTPGPGEAMVRVLLTPVHPEVIVDNEQGLILERTIAYRPLPALKLFRDAMYTILKDVVPPDLWDYPASDSELGKAAS